MIYRKTLVPVCVEPSKTIETPYIVKGMLLYLDKMEGNNVFQWVYVH